jgi:hypothetical protein
MPDIQGDAVPTRTLLAVFALVPIPKRDDSTAIVLAEADANALSAIWPPL